MAIEFAIIGALVILFLVSQYFWMMHTQKLVDKIMSGDYTIYAQSEKMLKRKDVRAEKIKVAPNGPNELGVLQDILG